MEKKRSTYKKRTLAAILALVLFFVGLAIAVMKNLTAGFDASIISFINLFNTPGMTSLMKNITFFGNTFTLYFIVPALVVLLALFRRPLSEPLLLTISTLGGWFLTEILKWFYHRPRPDSPLIPAEGYSFPSGHALMSVVVYGCLACIIYGFFQSKQARKLIIWLAVTFIILIGISRVYLGVHYPTDIIGGYAAGSAWLCFCLMMMGYQNR